MNLRELAAKLQLSTGTVSICLSGDPKKSRIAPDTVERVRAFAADVGYVPNGLAQKIFRRGDSDAVGILLIQSSAIHRNLPILAAAIERLNAAQREYTVLSATEVQLSQTLRTFKSLKIHQVIIIGMIYEEYITDTKSVKDMDIYALDYYFGREEPTGLFSYRGGIDRPELHTKLVRLLKQHGGTRVMCDANSNPQILLAQNLIEAADILPAPAPLTKDFFQYGMKLADQVLARQPRIVILHSDQAAIGLCHELLRRGIKIPDDIAIIGFNNSSFSPYAEIPLTTIALPMQRNLDAVLNHLLTAAPLPKEQKYDPQIICRATTPDALNKYLVELNPKLPQITKEVKND